VTEKTSCAVVGGGPAGMMLGLLLARAGVEVTVFEKHGDFLRDFRGDTVHPSTMRTLDQMGLWPQFDALTQSRITEFTADDDSGRPVKIVDFTRLRLPHRYISMVPQWDLLNLLAEAAAKEPTHTLRMQTEVTGLIRDGGRVVGVRYQGPDGPGELRADLTVGCDGRWSLVRRDAGLSVHDFPISFDTLWFRLPRAETDDGYSLFPRTMPGRAMVVIPREGYLQIALLIAKGSNDALRARGLPAFLDDLKTLLPEGADAIDTITSFDQIQFLDVKLNRLQRRWHAEGVLCIGDAAHAMSPAGGVGINVAVQDGVATARLLAQKLARGPVTGKDLAAVRRRRIVPTAITQALQRLIDRRLFGPVVHGGAAVAIPPGLIRTVGRHPWLAAIPAYLIGVGVRAEQAPDFARRDPRR
jgi:2-polyprenyl-6-methoxyphenol hydroxylase-like FAD-dependent oxidoreductase